MDFSQGMIMLIKVINCTNIEESDKIPSVLNLIRCAREGKHILIAERLFFENILKSSNFGLFDKNTAITLNSQRRENYLFRELLKLRIVVDFDYEGEIRNLEKDKKNIILLSYKYFHDSSFVQLSKLLCEDSQDYKLYKYIANYFIFRNKEYSNIKIDFDVKHGGGHRTKVEYDKFKNNNDLCLCLLDNDKKHPKGKIGGTMNAFSSKDFSLIKTTKACDIGVHEVESLIPNEVIDKFIQEYEPENRVSHIKFSNLVNSYPESKIFFDHKKGFKTKQIIELDNLYGVFWRPILLENKFSNKCIIKNNCECSTDCVVVNGYGDNLLSRAVDVMYSQSYKKTLEQLKSLEIFWNKIGEELLSWGCHLDKIRL